ncbi:MAG: hypothetical protein ACLVJ8_01430 [Ruthenibacterium lactatiformans]
MMRFFWMTFLPLSAAGGAAALLLWLARPALRRFAHIQWSVPVLTAALCLFVLPLPVFAMPGAWNAPAQAVQSSVGTVLPAEAAASEPLFVMTELPTAADKLLRAAPQEHISMLWAGPGVLAGRSIVCDAGFVGGIQAFHTSSGA